MLIASYQSAQQLIESDGFQQLSPQLKVAIFMGAMAFISSALVTMTAFTRIVIVLSFVRRSLATNEIPPTQVILGLSLFLTVFVMGPTASRIDAEALQPYLTDSITASVAIDRAAVPLKEFMLAQTRKKDIALFAEIAQISLISTPQETPLRVLIPAYIISELQTAFIMGFCLYVPFILVDLVVSVVLMSLGMMMMPPMAVSTPFKILLFVLVDGWSLIAKALTMSFR